MNLVFAGTPRFAAEALAALLAAGHSVRAVLTQPDRAAGRGMKFAVSAVKALALAHGLPLMQPATLRDAQVQQSIRDLHADLMVVAAYGLILPAEVLDSTPRGAFNIHASLLPRWRGAAPIQRALLAGDRETGVCIMRMEAGLDTGPVLLREALPIGDQDTAGTLHDRLAELGARLVVRAIAEIDSLRPEGQPDEGITYATKIGKHEARIDWTEPAVTTWRRIRAFDPQPGAQTWLHGEMIKLFSARLDTPDAALDACVPGEVLVADGRGVVIAAPGQALRILELQRAGGRRLPAADFLRGLSLSRGQRFEAAP